MEPNTATAVIGFVFGGMFLLVALFSTLSKATLVLFTPWLLRQVKYHDQPNTFRVVVFAYWLLGLGGIVAAFAALMER